MSEAQSPIPITLEPEHPQEVWIIQPPRARLWLHIVLLFATFLSTMVVGTRMQFNFAHGQPVFSLNDDTLSLFPIGWILDHPSRLLLGIPFSLTLMFILLAHEMGHYLYARHYRVYATLPFFVPFPSLIGTLGAFIRIKSPIPSRDALFDIGIAGPIAGFIPACVAVVTGLALSHPLIPSGGPLDNEPGFPLAFRLAAHLLHLHTPLASLSLHPIATAGWVGMFATSLNLLPGGQLDGGHILYSVFPKYHSWVSMLTVVVLVVLTKYFWIGWLLWSVLLWLTSHHPPVPSGSGISASRKALALFGVVMLTLAFTPAPFTGTAGRDVWPGLRDQGRETFHYLRDGARHLLHRH
jgi:Zn-dependent protease